MPLPGLPQHLPPPADPWAEPTPVGPPPTAPPPVAPPPTAPRPTGPPPTAPPPVAQPPTAPPPIAPRSTAPPSRTDRPDAAGRAARSPAGEPVARIGEITVTSSIVRTPTGDLPLTGSTWQVSDYWQHEQKTPMWAIAAAILGFFVLTVFSLLFLLVKETRHRGTVQVTVTSGQRQYVARLPVRSQDEVQRINQQVNYVRSLAAG